jgi:hypothetical protein
MAVTVILPILQDVTSCSLIEFYSSFEGIFCLRLQRRVYLKAGANPFVRNISTLPASLDGLISMDDYFLSGALFP